MASFSYLPALYQRNLSFHFQKESRSLTDLKDFCSSSLRKSILRQLNQKGTSFSDFAGGYRDCPTMLLNNLSGQIQTDARPLFSRTSGAVLCKTAGIFYGIHSAGFRFPDPRSQFSQSRFFFCRRIVIFECSGLYLMALSKTLMIASPSQRLSCMSAQCSSDSLQSKISSIPFSAAFGYVRFTAEMIVSIMGSVSDQAESNLSPVWIFPAETATMFPIRPMHSGSGCEIPVAPSGSDCSAAIC